MKYFPAIFACITILHGVSCQITGDPFCTKNSYLRVHDADSSVDVAGCSPALVWILARHGTRNPGDDDILEMKEQLPGLRDKVVVAWEEGRGDISEEDILRFLDWSFNLNVEDDGMLTTTGFVEHSEMGERWKERLSKYRDEDLNIQVRSSWKPRCKDSANSFLDSFLSESDARPTIAINNHLLRFFDECPKFINEVEENEETFAEKRELEASDEYSEMVARVGTRAGVEMTSAQVQLTWNMCRYERAWQSFNTSKTTYPVWCSLFTDDDLEILAFAEDLKYFYGIGPAYEITKKMTQPLFEDIFTQIENLDPTVSSPTVVLNFAHGETTQPLMAALGLHQNDKPLLASDWGTENQDHLWKTSNIASFGVNLALVVFNCGSSDQRVMLLENEQEIALPGCEAGAVFTLQQFSQYYKQYAQLDFEMECQ